MPIYEFYCRDNHKIYSFFARSLAYADRTPRCPENPVWHMEKVVSKFAVVGRAKEPEAEPAGGGDDPDDARMAAAMAQIEREMGGMDNLDSENPDPRQLAQVMRRMSALTGEQVPKDMEQMLRRMEAGESLEKLDDEYADVELPGGDGGSEHGETEKDPAALARLRSFRNLTRPAERVPTLYEMREFVG